MSHRATWNTSDKYIKARYSIYIFDNLASLLSLYIFNFTGIMACGEIGKGDLIHVNL